MSKSMVRTASTILTLQVLAVCVSVRADETMPYTGVVTDDDGNPIENVEIYLSDGEDEESNEWSSTRSDSRGKFKISPALAKAVSRWGDLLAYKPGWAISGINSLSHNERRIHIKLDRPTELSIRVLSPKGLPIRGGSIIWTRQLPPVLQQKLTRTTDESGIARLDWTTNGKEYDWEVVTKKFGRQYSDDQISHDGNLQIRLREVGRVTGEVVADDPRFVKDLKVTIGGGNCYETLCTDKNGRFEVPAFAASDGAWVELELDDLFPYRQSPDDELEFTVAPNKTTHMKFRLIKGIQVQGKVIDWESAKPIPNVEVTAFSVDGYASVQTDKDGVYRFVALPGECSLSVSNRLAGYYTTDEPTTIELKSSQTLSPIRIRRGIELSGRVLNENGQPALSAKVTATWRDDGTVRSTTTRTAQDGRYSLRVQRNVKLGLFAATKTQASTKVHVIETGDDDLPAVGLRIARDGVAPIVSRVIDTKGKPLVGARVKLVVRPPPPEAKSEERYSFSYAKWDEGEYLLTDEHGVFRTAVPIPLLCYYELMINAGEDVIPKSTEPRPVILDGEARLADNVLIRQLKLSGRVIDSNGEPISNATIRAKGAFSLRVRSSPEFAIAQSSTDGRFTLHEVHPNARFVFAEKPGYRFNGILLEEGKEIVLPLSLKSEPVEPSKRLRWQPWTNEQRGEFLHRLLPEWTLNTVWASTEVALSSVARFYPNIIEKALKGRSFAFSKSSILIELGEFDRAIAELEESNNRNKVDLYLKLVDHVDDRKMECIGKAGLISLAVKEPLNRLVALSKIADKLMELRKADMARQVVDEGLTVAKSLPINKRVKNSFRWMRFVESTAAVNLPAAVDLIKGFPNDELDSYRLDIATRAASTDPAAAEELLMKLEPSDGDIASVACQMATLDIERALRLINLIGSADEKSYAMGVIALNISEKHPERARGLLRQAVERPEKFWQSMPDVNVVDKSRLGRIRPRTLTFRKFACLVRIAETVDPDAVREYFWRAVAYHPRQLKNKRTSDAVDVDQLDFDLDVAQLAVFFALYNQHPNLVKNLTEPIIGHALDYKANRWRFETPFDYRIADIESLRLALGIARPKEFSLGYGRTLDREKGISFDQSDFLLTWTKLYAGKESEFWQVVVKDVFKVHY